MQRIVYLKLVTVTIITLSLAVTISVAMLRVFARTAAAHGIDDGEKPHHHGDPAATGTEQSTHHG